MTTSLAVQYAEEIPGNEGRFRRGERRQTNFRVSAGSSVCHAARKLANNQPCPRRKGSPTSMGPVDNTTAFRWLKSDRGPKPNEQLVTGFRYTYSLVQSFS